MMDIYAYWAAILRQDADAIRAYFLPDAYVNWNNTNEHFTVEEFIRANCEYPGAWNGEIERIAAAEDCTVTVTHVHTAEPPLSFHVTSFIRIVKDKIASIDEYWGDDGDAPQWRRDMHIGTKIR